MTVPPHTALPIEDVVPEIRTALSDAGIAVLTAPPGSGKTTVVPLRLLAEPWVEGRIVVLEPRRLATRAAARRMAWLLGEPVGETVGFVTRDERRTGRATRIEVVTEGVLTRRLQRDPSLDGTAAVLFDELHERNLQTDLGLALALDVRRSLRPDLRILAMSATIDSQKIAALLGGDGPPAPIVTGDAPNHPVEVQWVPVARRDHIEPHVASAIRRGLAADLDGGEPGGDVLVFLPGMAEIRRVAGLLADLPDHGIDVRILHGSLPSADQDAAIAPSPGGRRKVVLSTDIAESSLTVEGIRIVVDTGLARAPRYDMRTGMTRLRTVSISKASADQRTGRAGRTGPGTAYRLWSKMEHAGRGTHIEPEITEVDLAGLALELAAWGAEVADLPFLDAPPARALAEARRLLTSLGALDGSGGLTALGRRMVDLPLHPRLAHMVAAAGADTELAALLAALVDERDILHGHPDDLPVGVDERLRLLLDRDARHPRASGGAIARTRAAAHDLMRRIEVSDGPVDPARSGRLLALAFPDRLAIRRGSPGRFQLRTGTTAWMAATDPLAIEPFLIVPDLDGKRKDARIRLAAAIDPEQVAETFADEVDQRTALEWDGDRLVERVSRRLGGITLDIVDRRPEAGPATVEAIVKRLRRRGLDDLPWTPGATALRHRVAFLRQVDEGLRQVDEGLRQVDEGSWPDWSDAALRASLEDWLAPALRRATGYDAVARLDLVALLRTGLGHPWAHLVDRSAPTHLTLPNGRRVPVDYSERRPVVAVAVQQVFGVTENPVIAGVPVVFHLLSPAGRPVQVTADLAGFWAGSWQQVRKEMASRYPKHPWPEHPGRG